MSGRERADQARRITQAQAAHADRGEPVQNDDADTPIPEDTVAEVVPLQWPDQARRAEQAVDAERRRRREGAVSTKPKPPPLLRDAIRGASIFHIPDDEPGPGSLEDEETGVIEEQR